jgi:cytochrome o ubiquinol oxidase subunit II
VVPAGVPVHFSITSASVMNMFFVPQLGSMIAAMNGMVTQLSLKADNPGEFHGLSTQYSGDGFAGMQFTLRAVPQDAYAQWVSQVRASGPTLDLAAYLTLARQSQNVTPFTYRTIDAGLFNAVARREVPPAPGPEQGRGGPTVHPTPGG